MKKLLSLLFMASTLAYMVSCGSDDDDDPKTFDAPTVSAPSIADQENGATGVTASFTVSVDADLTATWAATTTGGITLTESSGTVSGASIDLIFDAGTPASSTAASITVTVTDEEGQVANATAVFTVLAPGDAPITFNGNDAIPATATLTEGDILEVTGVTVEGADGVASVTVTVNGTVNDALGQTYDGTNASETYGFSVNTGDLGAGTYLIIFTAEDANGSQDSFEHLLTVEPEVTVFTITENISADATWEGGKTYILGGRITVLSGATLTIGAGAVIKGEAGTQENATALLVARGATLNASGTAELPIIFTSVADEITPEMVAAGNYASPNLDPDINGLWGGVIVLGSGIISASNDAGDLTEVQIEGIPTSDTNGLYGGTDDTDNSGTISYISIRHGGSNIGSGNEINGLTLGGVGSGTTISNVEIVSNQDDGIEWFGGAVSIDGVVVWNSFDDGLDTDQAWVGTCSNYVVVTPRGGSAFELDGPEGTETKGGAMHTFHNGTVYAGDEIDHIVDWDGSTNAAIHHLYIYGIDSAYAPTGAAIESFGGTDATASMSWEVTLPSNVDPALTLTDIFGAGAAAIITEVNTNANAVGVLNDDNFKWTWAGASGALDGIGL